MAGSVKMIAHYTVDVLGLRTTCLTAGAFDLVLRRWIDPAVIRNGFRGVGF